MTEEVVIRAFEWFDRVSAAEGSIKDNGYLIFEIMQKVHSVRIPTFQNTLDLMATIRQHSTLHRYPELRPHGLIPPVLDTSSSSEPAAVPTPTKARTSWHESSSWKAMITSLRNTRLRRRISFPTPSRISMTQKR